MVHTLHFCKSVLLIGSTEYIANKLERYLSESFEIEATHVMFSLNLDSSIVCCSDCCIKVVTALSEFLNLGANWPNLVAILL